LNVFIVNTESLNCSQSSKLLNIPCLYIEELKKFEYFDVNYEKPRKIFTTLKFNNPGVILKCDEVFDALDILEMKKAFLVVEFSEKNFINEIFKNIFLLAYRRMTERIFIECKIKYNDRFFNVADMNEEEIEMKYNKSGFWGIAFM
jgi:hypothetical protein